MCRPCATLAEGRVRASVSRRKTVFGEIGDGWEGKERLVLLLFHRQHLPSRMFQTNPNVLFTLVGAFAAGQPEMEGVGSPFPQLSSDIPVGQLHFCHVLPKRRVVLTEQAVVCSFQFQTLRFPLMKKMGALVVLILCGHTACQLEGLSSSKPESRPHDEGHDALEPQSSNVGNVRVILKAKTEAFVSDLPAFLALPCDLLYFTHFVPLGNLCGSCYSVVQGTIGFLLPRAYSQRLCIHVCQLACERTRNSMPGGLMLL